MNIIFIAGAWAPVLGWAGLIFYLSSIPGLKTNLGLWDLVLRKGAHVTEYAILTGLLIRALRMTRDQFDLKKIFLWSGGLAFVYAVSDEIHQSFVPGRGPSVLDVLIDTVGVVLCLYYFSRKNRRMVSNEN